MPEINRADQRPVVIVGAGPVGMGLALHLSFLGVKSLLVEAREGPLAHPRGNTHNSRTMEHYRKLGLAREIRQIGLPFDYPTDVGYFTAIDGYELARIPMSPESAKVAALRTAPATGQVVEPIFRCNQMYVEALLHRKVMADPNIEARFGWECVAWHDEGDQVSVTLHAREGGHTETLACLFLAGADGGQSRLRRALDIRFSGRPYREQSYAGGLTASTYVRVPGFYTRTRHARCWQYSIVSPKVRSNLVALNGTDAFLFSTRLKPDADEADRQAVHRQLLMSLGADWNYEYVSSFTWTAGQALVADRYGAGRIVLAGDAVHLFTPQGGFGMNTGMDDVANLAWKLAALVQGWGGPALLASYEQERRPVAIRNTSAAQGTARHIGDIPLDAHLLESGPAGDLARRQVGAAFGQLTEEFASLGIQLGARYDGSDIIWHDGAAPPADDPYHYQPSSVPGGRCPHLWLEPGQHSVYDGFGRGFTLLCIGARADEAAGLVASARQRGVPVKALSVPHPAARELYEAEFVLVRPDCHVAWRGDAIPEDAGALLAHVTGWGVGARDRSA